MSRHALRAGFSPTFVWRGSRQHGLFYQGPESFEALGDGHGRAHRLALRGGRGRGREEGKVRGRGRSERGVKGDRGGEKR